MQDRNICWFLLSFCLMLSWTAIIAQAISPSKRVITLGNTADLPIENVFYENLRSIINTEAISTTIIINGDFTDGSRNYWEDSLRITQLLGTTRGLDHVSLVFIPGDRDWVDSGPQGWTYVRRLEKLVDRLSVPNVFWPIRHGCPGPKEISLSENVVLIAIQTQWWNHPYRKPIPGDADCKIAEEADFIEELKDLIDDNAGKNILLAGHFPIESYGPYGGKWPLRRYLLPIPLLSGMYPSFRSNVGTLKDISNHRFTPLREALLDLMQEHHQLIYLSAHERNLQILKHNDHYLINSGSPFVTSYTGKGRSALYAESQTGFIELKFFDKGKVEAAIHRSNTEQIDENFTIPLYGSGCQKESSNVPNNLRITKCGDTLPQAEAASNPRGTSTLAAGMEYEAGKIKQSWLGKHYRDSWTTKVTVPYLNLDTTFQGLTPIQKGGGRQTTSLQFKAGNGGQYVFRSVNKDPTKALDYEYRETVIGSVIRDQTSTQQPYGALAVDHLLNQLDILHASPRLYVLPEQNQLGMFKEEFSGLFGMLEERPTNPKNVKKPFGQADDVLKSYEMFRELYQDHDNKVDAKEFARARAFDLLIGDWGKHEDNWKWAGYKSKKGMTYRPIPRDRDHAFSLWDGILPWLADREWAKPSAANFDYKYEGIRSLMWQARHLDRFLASELDSNDWIEAAKFIQDNLNETHIDEAVKRMPEEIYEGDGKIIGEKLKERLKNLNQATTAYYHLLAKEVDVVGSNKKEYFDVRRAADGTVEVTVLDVNDSTEKPDTSRIFYKRRFLPQETKEIRLYGLQKDDYFNISGKADKSIPIRIIGGSGEDQIVDSSTVKGGGKMTRVYEKNRDALLDLGTEGKLIKHWDDGIYHYDRTAFKYDTYFPILFISSSKDFGIGLRGGVQFTQQRFAKKDFSSKHSVQVALSNESIKVLDYKAQYRHVFGKWDLLVEALAADHFYFTYFFGIGNDTEKDDELFEDNYYRTSYNSYQLAAGLKHQIWDEGDSHFTFKLRYENNEEQIGENTILKDPENTQDVLGVDDTNIIAATLDLDLDFRDRVSLPEKGMRANIQHQSGLVSSNDYQGYGLILASLEGFITAYLNRPITLGLRLGGSTSYGEVPFYKFKYLGQGNDLRGFLRNRFAGESTMFLNTELRWELSEVRTSFFPIKIGLKAFYDTGRVYSSYDLSNQWHYGIGGGFYLIPLKEEYSLNVSLAFSDEESGLLLLGIGKAF